MASLFTSFALYLALIFGGTSETNSPDTYTRPNAKKETKESTFFNKKKNNTGTVGTFGGSTNWVEND
ncbi:hypothetical protein [Pontibacter harenae]|uniref:hypothetical protein n=1 Tax=Pontibacter harenae TaxID=2894083 RepID=UPI001E54D358|nr:hypothetical protein [Pontibacter harenae]MCC9167935.1 hypothetical protein [Pontibacter harenae]